MHLGQKWKGYRHRGLNGKIELYDLSTDQGEQNDLAAKHPEIVAQIEQIMLTDRTPNPKWKMPGIDRPLTKK